MLWLTKYDNSLKYLLFSTLFHGTINSPIGGAKQLELIVEVIDVNYVTGHEVLKKAKR